MPVAKTGNVYFLFGMQKFAHLFSQHLQPFKCNAEKRPKSDG